MDILSKRYANFLKFLKDLGLGSEPYVRELNQVNSIIFVTKLREGVDKYKQGSDKEKIDKGFDEMIKELNINPNDYKKENITKFKRFLLYFYLTSKELF